MVTLRNTLIAAVALPFAVTAAALVGAMLAVIGIANWWQAERHWGRR